MPIRIARPDDFAAVHRLAAALDLDYEGLENDRVWVEEADGLLAGIVALKTHPDSRELVSLGVDPNRRSAGLGGALIEALMAETTGDVYLATIIPAFFERYGFVRTLTTPVGMAKDPSWCEGCPKQFCTTMVRTQS